MLVSSIQKVIRLFFFNGGKLQCCGLCCTSTRISHNYIHLLLFSREVVSDSFVTSGTVAHRLLCPWDFPGKNTGVGCHFLLQGIFPTKGSNLLLLNWQADWLPQMHQESQIEHTTLQKFWNASYIFIETRMYSISWYKQVHNNVEFYTQKNQF